MNDTPPKMRYNKYANEFNKDFLNSAHDNSADLSAVIQQLKLQKNIDSQNHNNQNVVINQHREQDDPDAICSTGGSSTVNQKQIPRSVKAYTMDFGEESTESGQKQIPQVKEDKHSKEETGTDVRRAKEKKGQQGRVVKIMRRNSSMDRRPVVEEKPPFNNSHLRAPSFSQKRNLSPDPTNLKINEFSPSPSANEPEVPFSKKGIKLPYETNRPILTKGGLEPLQSNSGRRKTDESYRSSKKNSPVIKERTGNGKYQISLPQREELPSRKVPLRSPYSRSHLRDNQLGKMASQISNSKQVAMSDFNYTLYSELQNPNNPLYQVDVLCLNCMQMVKSHLAEEHSLHCFAENNEVKFMELCSPIQQLDFRVRKLRESLQKILKEIELRKRDPKDEMYVTSLVCYAEQLLHLQDYTKYDILKSREIISNIMMMLKNFQGGPSVLLHADRLKVLAKEKHGEIVKIYRTNINTNQNEQRLSEVSKEQLSSQLLEQKQQWRNTINEAQKYNFSASKEKDVSPKEKGKEKENEKEYYANNELIQPNALLNPRVGVNDIESDIDTKSQSMSASESMTSLGSSMGISKFDNLTESEKNSRLSVHQKKITRDSETLNSLREAQEVIEVETKKKLQEENLKRYFFSICTQAKRTFGMNHMAYFVETPVLYQEVKNQNVPVNEWPDFILNQLKDAEKWVDVKKLHAYQKKLRNSKNVSIRSQSPGKRGLMIPSVGIKFETIQEETCEEESKRNLE